MKHRDLRLAGNAVLPRNMIGGGQGRNRTTDTRIFRLRRTRRLTGLVYDVESIQEVRRKQEDARGKPGKLKTGAPVQNLAQTTPVSPREAYKHCVRFTSGHATNLEWAVDDKIDQHGIAEYLGVSTRTVRTLIKRGEVPPPIRIGQKQIWLKDEFTRWLHDGGAASIQVRSARNVANSIIRRGRPRLPA
jgi:predicted DNA-binding transcriptional regulator AlpA